MHHNEWTDIRTQLDEIDVKEEMNEVVSKK
jgi:hypothetical protein